MLINNINDNQQQKNVSKIVIKSKTQKLYTDKS